MSEQNSTVFGASGLPPLGTSDGSSTEDPVALLVGEGKKFKTVPDLAKGKLEADAFIARLTEENKALRQVALGNDGEGTTRTVEQLLASQKGNGTTANPMSNQSQGEPLTTEKVLDLLEKREQLRQLKTNSDLFNSTIAKAYGSKATETVMQRINDLGLDLETFNGLVSRNPQSALKIIGVKESAAASQGDISGKSAAVNTAAVFSPESNGSQTKNFAYFEGLRKSMGAAFYAQNVQQEMIKARKELGPDFFK